MNPYKITGTPAIDHVHYNHERLASAAALTMAALTPDYESPTEAAEATLTQLSCELTCLAELIDGGTELNSGFITTWIRGMAHRADVAVELAAPVHDANRTDGEKIPSEAAE